MRIGVIAIASGLSVLGAGARAGTIHVPADFTSIQAAIDNANNNDTIVVAKGNYNEVAEIVGKSFLTLKASGKVRITGTNQDSGILVQNSDHVEVRGFTVTGGDFQNVYVVGCADVRVTGCIIGGTANVGISVADSLRVRIDRNIVDGVPEVGILVAPPPPFAPLGPTGANDSVFEKNRVRDAGSTGISITGANCTVSKNRVERPGEDGIVVDGSTTSVKNRVIDAAKHGYVSIAGVQSSFTKDKVIHSAGDDFGLNCQNSSIVKCSSSRAGSSGFFVVVTATGNTFTKCKVKRATDDGFQVDGTTNTFDRCRTTKSGALGLNDAAGGATTNIYDQCKFDSTNLP